MMDKIALTAQDFKRGYRYALPHYEEYALVILDNDPRRELIRYRTFRGEEITDTYYQFAPIAHAFRELGPDMGESLFDATDYWQPHTAETGVGGDAYPAEEPQAASDRQQDSELHRDYTESLDRPQQPEEWLWTMTADHIYVVPSDEAYDHGDLYDFMQHSDFHRPHAHGKLYLTANWTAEWTVEDGNMSLHLVEKRLRGYSREQGWKWKELLDEDAKPFKYAAYDSPWEFRIGMKVRFADSIRNDWPWMAGLVGTVIATDSDFVTVKFIDPRTGEEDDGGYFPYRLVPIEEGQEQLFDAGNYWQPRQGSVPGIGDINPGIKDWRSQDGDTPPNYGMDTEQVDFYGQQDPKDDEIAPGPRVCSECGFPFPNYNSWRLHIIRDHMNPHRLPPGIPEPVVDYDEPEPRANFNNNVMDTTVQRQAASNTLIAIRRAQSLLDMILRDEGVTGSLDMTPQSFAQGYSVSLAAYETKRPANEITALDVVDKTIQLVELNQPNTFFGGWLDEGIVYLDISTWLADLIAAESMGLAESQLGLYDWRARRTLRLGPDGRYSVARSFEQEQRKWEKLRDAQHFDMSDLTLEDLQEAKAILQKQQEQGDEDDAEADLARVAVALTPDELRAKYAILRNAPRFDISDLTADDVQEAKAILSNEREAADWGAVDPQLEIDQVVGEGLINGRPLQEIKREVLEQHRDIPMDSLVSMFYNALRKADQRYA